MNDPLDAVFVTGEEAEKLKQDRQVTRLALYLYRMPVELKPLFRERFAPIKQEDRMSAITLGEIARSELAALRADIARLTEERNSWHDADAKCRADLQAAHERIAALESEATR